MLQYVVLVFVVVSKHCALITSSVLQFLLSSTTVLTVYLNQVPVKETLLAPISIVIIIKNSRLVQNNTMKTSVAIIAACVASTSAFAPSNNGARAVTSLNESFFSKVFGMDLFAPVQDQNDYGARTKKNVSYL